MSTARSISQVSREPVHLDLRGSVQTVFPAHSCMQPSANSETQDYGTLGSDGPLEGATKVLQMILRDLGGGHGDTHRLNAFFYDNWADAYSHLNPGDEVVVSGPSARLVRVDNSAGSGDHPYCLAFYTPRDDMVAEVGTVAADVSGTPLDDAGVTLKVVKAVENVARGGPAGRDGQQRRNRHGERDEGGRGKGAGSRKGAKQGNTSYVYTNLASLQSSDGRANVYGVVCSFNHPHQSKGRDMTVSVSLLDESCPESDNAIPCNFFMPTRDGLPAPAMVGDIMRIHRAKLQTYRGRPQLLGIHGASWLIIRKKQAMRDTFQLGVSPGGGGGDGRVGGGGSDEDFRDDDESPPSGPDAGGGAVNSLFPPMEWQVLASSVHYTVSHVDFDRCNALNAWFISKAPRLCLNPSSEPKTWVSDTFRPPESGPTVVEVEVDLVCCLVSKQEQSGGGAGSLKEVHVSDGSGLNSPLPRKPYDDQRDAALLKGIRTALGQPDWSPNGSQSQRAPLHLRVEVKENEKEWEALKLSPGMWVRLRRLTLIKTRHDNMLSAKMRESTSSINPLHPNMAEVQAKATAYARHCIGPNENESTSSTSMALAATENSTESVGARGVPSANVAQSPSTLSQQRGHCREDATERGRDKNNDAPMGSPVRRVRRAGMQQAPTQARDVCDAGAKVADVSEIDRRNRTAPLSKGWQPPTSNRRPRGGAANTGRTRQHVSDVHDRTVSGCGPDAGASTARITKRPLELPTNAGMGDGSVGGVQRALADDGALLSNLGLVRCTSAPTEFNVRVRVVGHFPPKVEDFVRVGPGLRKAPRFLFTLRLEDDHGVVDAVVSGLHAMHLLHLEGTSPAQFLSDEDSRRAVAQALEKREGEFGEALVLRLRSYLTPIAGGGGRWVGGSARPAFCKRFSIVASHDVVV